MYSDFNSLEDSVFKTKGINLQSISPTEVTGQDTGTYLCERPSLNTGVPSVLLYLPQGKFRISSSKDNEESQ